MAWLWAKPKGKSPAKLVPPVTSPRGAEAKPTILAGTAPKDGGRESGLEAPVSAGDKAADQVETVSKDLAGVGRIPKAGAVRRELIARVLKAGSRVGAEKTQTAAGVVADEASAEPSKAWKATL